MTSFLVGEEEIVQNGRKMRCMASASYGLGTANLFRQVARSDSSEVCHNIPRVCPMAIVKVEKRPFPVLVSLYRNRALF